MGKPHLTEAIFEAAEELADADMNPERSEKARAKLRELLREAQTLLDARQKADPPTEEALDRIASALPVEHPAHDDLGDLTRYLRRREGEEA